MSNLDEYATQVGDQNRQSRGVGNAFAGCSWGGILAGLLVYIVMTALPLGAPANPAVSGSIAAWVWNDDG